VLGGYNFVEDTADPMDDNGHGTHVAGIVAANGVLHGVAPDAQLLAYKVCDAGGSCHQSAIIAGLEAAADPDGNPLTADAVEVVNLSLGGPGDPADPLSQTVDNAAAIGIVVVVAAGNSGPGYESIGSPGVARSALTVAAADKRDVIAGFSSRGPVPYFYDIVKPDITAPGVDIYSTAPITGFLGSPDRYLALSGTSMATPHVAGAAALLAQLHSDWTSAMIKAALMNTAQDLGESVHLQGIGRLDVAQAATNRMLLVPPSFNLGVVDLSQPVWRTTRDVTITNHFTTTREFEMAVGSDLPAGVAVMFEPQRVGLPAGASRVVSFTVTVDNAVVPNAPEAPGTYEGDLIVVAGMDTWRAPFVFVKSPLVNVIFDETPWVFIFHDQQNTERWIPYPTNPLVFFAKDGVYDAMAIYHPIETSTRVVREGIVVTEQGVTVRFNKSDAIHQISFAPKGETGQAIAPSFYLEYFTHRDSRIGYWLAGGYFSELHISPFSNHYSLQWLASTAGLNNGPVYDFNGYVEDGLNSDLLFENSLADLIHHRYHYWLPAEVTKIAAMHVLSEDYGAVSVYQTQNPPLQRPFMRDIFSMQMPSHFYWKYHYEELYHYADDPFDIFDGELLLRTPHLSVADSQTLHGYHFYQSTPVLVVSDADLMFGLAPPHWAGRLDNTPTQVMIQSISFWWPYVYLNQMQDHTAAAPPSYALYHEDELIEQGKLERWDWSCGPCIAIPVLSPNTYMLRVSPAPYRIGATTGVAQTLLTFDTSLDDPDPPNLHSLTIAQEDQMANLIFAEGPGAVVKFEIGDESELGDVAAEYATDDSWQPLVLHGGALSHATAFTATMPVFPAGSTVSLRITAADVHGNRLMHEMNPAFLSVNSHFDIYLPLMLRDLP